jgi:hypothetical protein
MSVAAARRSLFAELGQDGRSLRWLAAQEEAAAIEKRTAIRYPFTIGKYADKASAVALKRWDRGVGLSATTTTETILFASHQLGGAGSNTAGQDGALEVGTYMRLWVSGFLTTIATAGTITLNMRLNSISGNSLGASIAITPIVSITKGAWIFEARCMLRSTGSSGTIIGAGQITFGSTVVTATAPGRTFLLPDVNSDATATIDTTATNQVVFTTLMTQAHTMTAQMGNCEVLN